MPELEVRPARPDDAEVVAALVADALTLAVGLRGGPGLLETLGVDPGDPAALATALCGGTAGPLGAYVAELDGDVVGVALVAREGPTLDLVGVHVARPLRRRRLGTALLEAAREVAATSGCQLEALALPGDQSTKSLLEAAGYKARLLRMSAER